MFQGHFDLETATPVETAIPDLLFERGLYWASGRSGMVNLVAAHKWFNLAALKGRVDAISMRREVAEMMSDVEIATAQREARAWMTAHLDGRRQRRPTRMRDVGIPDVVGIWVGLSVRSAPVS